MYTGEFNPENMVRTAHAWNNFNRENRDLKPSEKTLEILGSGVFYIFGRDIKYRPCIMIVVKKVVLDKDHEPLDYIYAFIFLTAVIKRYMLYPGKVEQIIVLFDSKDVGIMFLPVISTIRPHMRIGAITIGCIISKGVILRPEWMFGHIIRQVRGKIPIYSFTIS